MRVVVLSAVAIPILAEIASNGATAAKLVQAFPECRLSLHDARMPYGVRVSLGKEAMLTASGRGVEERILTPPLRHVTRKGNSHYASKQKNLLFDLVSGSDLKAIIDKY